MKKEMNPDKEHTAPVPLITPEHLSDIDLLNHVPFAVFVCDLEGRIIKYNEQAALTWGRRPSTQQSELYSGALHQYSKEGKPILPEDSPVARYLHHENASYEDEMIIERPDSSRVTVSLDIKTLSDGEGYPIGIVCCMNDITSQTQKEIPDPKRYRELVDYVENATVALHWLDADGEIIWANKAELDLVGYKENEYIGHHISEFHVHQHKVNDILTRLNQDEVIDGYETELICRDGSIKTVQISSSVYREGEKFIHTRCFTVDITRQKRLADALEDSEARQKMILENIPSAIYTCDADGYVTFFNKAAEKFWLRTPVKGQDRCFESWKIKNPDGSPMLLKDSPMARCLKEGVTFDSQEIIIELPNGEERNIVPHTQPIFDKNEVLTGAAIMLLDITQAKKKGQDLYESDKKYRELAASFEKVIEAKTLDLKFKNDELKKSEERYHKMVEEVEDYAIILLDENGFIQNWNKGAEKIKGYKEQEILGKSFQVFYLPHDRESGLPLRLINQARYKGKAIHEGWRMRADGTRFWGSIVLTALHSQQNEIIGFSKVTRDLTERKLAEDKLRDYTNQLKFQNEQLEQFAYAASHDMKEPLRKILFYNNHLLETSADLLPVKEREYLNRSISAARRMERLINDLLEYSKASSDTHGAEDVDLNEILDEILVTYKDGLEEKNAEIRHQSLPVVTGISFQLRQVFENIISNAIKYHHPDRSPVIEILSSIVSGQNIQGLLPEQQYHLISISDNGIGFDPDYSEKIFELFQRLGHVQYSGTGVGLALCKRIVQKHHGTIIANSRENAGAQFDIYLPV